MNFGRVTAPHVGEYVPQWRWVRLPLIARKSGEKRRGIEAIVGTWGGWGTRGSSTEITCGNFDPVFTYLNLKIKNRGMVVHISGGVRAKVMVAGGRGMIVQ